MIGELLNLHISGNIIFCHFQYFVFNNDLGLYVLFNNIH